MSKREAVSPAARHALYDAHRYSAAIRSGDLLFVSGQVGSREDGSPEPTFEAQVRRAFAIRNGRKTWPSARGGVLSRAGAMSATVLPSRFTVPVTTLVAFMVHTSGSHPPLDEQNGATLPVGSCAAPVAVAVHRL